MSLPILLKPLFSRRVSLTLGVWGEAGIGKTFAVSSALRESPLRSFTVHATASNLVIARAPPQPVRLPVWAERQLERIWRGEIVDVLNSVAVFSTLLVAIAPVILHVEDLHEANPERLEFWTALGEAVQRTKGVGLIVTGRTLPPEVFRPVRLEPLSKPNLDALLETEAGSSVPPEALAWIYKRAVGNPLFAIEFFRFLARRGHLWSDAKRWHWREPPADLVPVTVEALIETVLSRVQESPEIGLLLEVKALLPLGSGEDLWARVAGLEPETLLEMQARLEHDGILAHSEFVHPLYREIMVRNLNTNRRRELSRRALEALVDEDLRAAVLFIKDAKLEPERALVLLEGAAEIAREANDPAQEARFLVEASEYASAETRGRLALEAAQRIASIDLAQAVRLAEIASSYDIQRSAAIRLLAQLFAKQLRGTEAETLLAQLPESERSPEQDFAWLIELRSSTHQHERVLELLRASPDLLERASAKTIYHTCLSLIGSGLIDEAARTCETARSRPDLSQDDQDLLRAVDARLAYLNADFAQMERFEHEGLEHGLRTGDLRLAGRSAFNLSLALRHLGRYHESLGTLEQGRGLFLELKDLTAYMIVQMMYGTTLHDLGRHEEAEEHLLEAHDALSRRDVSGFLHDCECSLSILYRDWRPPHGPILAHKYALAAIEHARHLQDRRMEAQGLQVLAMAEVMAGHANAALEASVWALRIANELQLPVAVYEAKIAHGHALVALGRNQEGLVQWREGQREAEAAGDFIVAQMTGFEIDHFSHDHAGVERRLALLEKHGLVNAVNVARRRFGLRTPRIDHESAASPVQLQVLGPARILLGEEIISGRAAKRLELLVCLLEARITGRAEVSQLELFDALYPDVTEDQAAQSLKKMVQLVRDQLGRGAIQTTANGYAIAEVCSDAEEFLETLDTRLWRGTYLESVRLEHGNDTVRDVLHRALHSRIETILEVDPKEAARAARILLEAEPYDASVLELTVRSLRASDNHKSLNRTYSEARTRMLEVGETLPERWQEFLSRDLKPA